MKKGLSVAVLNINVENKGVRRRSILAYSIASNLKHLDDDTDYEIGDVDNMDEVTTAPKDKDFFIKFVAEEMRCLALIAHAHMKPELEKFVKNNKNILRKFRLTGNHTTMKILNKVYGDDPLVRYGPTCQSGALGGDAQLVSLMCLEELGGIVFLQDPMESHMHQVDIDCLNRQVCVHDIYLASNASSAYAMMSVLRISLKKGNKARISSFFETKESPSVAEYKKRQKAVLDQNIANAKRDAAAAKAPEVEPKEMNEVPKKKKSSKKFGFRK